MERPLLCCPEGTSLPAAARISAAQAGENSPAFQRWVEGQKVASPEGTAAACLSRRTKWPVRGPTGGRGREGPFDTHSFGRPFGACVFDVMFSRVKKPGHFQKIPPGQKKAAPRFV